MNLLRRRRVPCLAFVTTIVTLALGGCTALEQFPAVSANYKTDLTAQDPNYADALDLIKAAAANPDEQERIRNEEIDRRLRVIDLNFTKFETGLAQENVQVGFLVSVVEVGVGVTGALVSETVGQILSATSGGLAGSQAAYAKAALFNKALSALLAQMIAGRKAILATPGVISILTYDFAITRERVGELDFEALTTSGVLTFSEALDF